VVELRFGNRDSYNNDLKILSTEPSGAVNIDTDAGLIRLNDGFTSGTVYSTNLLPSNARIDSFSYDEGFDDYSSIESQSGIVIGNSMATVEGPKRKKITITERSGNTLTDYQVKIPVAYEDDMKPDFSDLRFYDASGTLPYWIEDYTAGSSGNVWVKVPLIPANTSVDIYMGYGNPSATSASDGDATFEFFDDFDDASIDSSKWDTGGTPSESGGILTIDDGGDCIRGKTNFTFKALRARANTVSGYTAFGFINVDTADGNQLKPFEMIYGFSTSTKTYSGTTTNSESTDVGDYMNAYHIYDINWRSGEAKFYIDGSLVDTDTTYVSASAIPVGFSIYSPNSGVGYLDWILVRKYASPEPDVVVAEEENTPTSYLTGNLNESLANLRKTFNYNAKAPLTGDYLFAAYSEDNTNWYSSSGYVNTWDALASGSDSIDISGLGFSNPFYYKIKIEPPSGDALLYDVSTDYEESVSPPSGCKFNFSEDAETWSNDYEVTASGAGSIDLGGANCDDVFYYRATLWGDNDVKLKEITANYDLDVSKPCVKVEIWDKNDVKRTSPYELEVESVSVTNTLTSKVDTFEIVLRNDSGKYQ